MNYMIEDPKKYFSQWIPSRSELHHTLEKQAQTEQIPIVGPVVGQLLYIAARMLNAQLIVELGAAIGYSTLFLGEACRCTEGRTISYEMSPELAKRAKANIQQADLSDSVEIRCENALEGIKSFMSAADMIFMDIDKENYLVALSDCERILRPGGILFVDNTGFKDADAFNKAIQTNVAWESVNIWSLLPGHSPENDGFCIALKK